MWERTPSRPERFFRDRLDLNLHMRPVRQLGRAIQSSLKSKVSRPTTRLWRKAVLDSLDQRRQLSLNQIRRSMILTQPKKPALTTELLQSEAASFAVAESAYAEPLLFGVTDGKAVGTYLEHKFRAHLQSKFEFILGSSASGIDFPELEVDMKVTSIKQPQSSCPFKSARQKICGLGYSLLVFVYDKTDDEKARKAKLNILHTIFVTKERTGDFQTTTGIRKILENAGNKDDLLAFVSGTKPSDRRR